MAAEPQDARRSLDRVMGLGAGVHRDATVDTGGGRVAAQAFEGEGTVRHLNVKLPVSIALGAHAYLHLNPGLSLTSGSRRAFTPSVAIEKLLLERTIAFAELARERELRFGQIGARHWLKREKLALDFALQQQRIEGRQSSGFILGLGVYDF
jgi:hypothetical protein